MVSGGRDINPEEYNEQNTQSYVAPDSSLRFHLIRAILRIAPLGLPYFGICAGYQILNVIYGGSMIQDQGGEINCRHKNNALGEVQVSPNSWLYQTTHEIKSICNHHQNIKSIG